MKEIKIKKIGMLNGKEDYQYFCPICEVEFRGYNKELLFGNIKAHLEISHKIILEKNGNNKK